MPRTGSLSWAGTDCRLPGRVDEDRIKRNFLEFFRKNFTGQKNCDEFLNHAGLLWSQGLCRYITGTPARNDHSSPVHHRGFYRSPLSVGDTPYFGDMVIRAFYGLRLASFSVPETGFVKKEDGLEQICCFFTPKGRDIVWQSCSGRSLPKPEYRPDRQCPGREFLRNCGG